MEAKCVTYQPVVVKFVGNASGPTLLLKTWWLNLLPSDEMTRYSIAIVLNILPNRVGLGTPSPGLVFYGFVQDMAKLILDFYSLFRLSETNCKESIYLDQRVEEVCQE